MSSDIFECRGFAECDSRCVSTDAAVPAALVRRTVLVALIQYRTSCKKERAFTKFSYFSRPCPVGFSPHAHRPVSGDRERLHRNKENLSVNTPMPPKNSIKICP